MFPFRRLRAAATISALFGIAFGAVAVFVSGALWLHNSGLRWYELNFRYVMSAFPGAAAAGVVVGSLFSALLTRLEREAEIGVRRLVLVGAFCGAVSVVAFQLFRNSPRGQTPDTLFGITVYALLGGATAGALALLSARRSLHRHQSSWRSPSGTDSEHQQLLEGAVVDTSALRKEPLYQSTMQGSSGDRSPESGRDCLRKVQ